MSSPQPPRRGTVAALFIAHGLGSVSIGITGVVVAVTLFERSGSTGWATVGAVVRVAPFVALSALAGTVADRYSPRAGLMVALLSQGMCAAALVAVAPDAPFAAVAALGLAAHSGWTLAYPSMAASIARTVPADRLGPVNGVLSTVESLAWIGGPGLGGLVIAASGTRAASTVAVVAAVAAVATLVSVKLGAGAAGERVPIVHSMREGVRALTSSRGLVASLVMHLAANLVYGAMSVLLLIAATARFGMGSGGYGVLTGALSFGSLAALVAVRRLTTRSSLLPVLSASVLLCGAPIALMAAAEAPAWAIALAALSGVGTVLAEVIALTTVQRAVPLHTVGRVFGLLDSLTVGVVLLGTAAAGVLVDLIGLERSMVVVGAMVPAAVVLAAPRLFGVRGGSVGIPLGQLLAGLPMLALARPSSLGPTAEAGAGLGGHLLGTPPEEVEIELDVAEEDPEDDAVGAAPSVETPVVPAAFVDGWADTTDDIDLPTPVGMHVDVDPWDHTFDHFGTDVTASDHAIFDHGLDDGFDDGFDDLTLDH